MPLDVLDKVERDASGAAFAQACDYLDSINKTDLIQATQAELEEFQRIYLTSYEKEMRQRVETSGQAPY